MVWEKLTRLDETKDRSFQEYLGTPSTYDILLQFEARSNFTKHSHMQSFSTTHCPPYAVRKRMYENEGGAPPKGTLNYKIATGCTRSEFAQRSTRSTRARRKIILGPTQRIEELQGNLEQRRWLQNSWHTPFDSRTAEYKSPKQGQEVDRKVREPPAQGILPSGLEPDAEDQQVQQRLAGFDRRNEHRDLGALRKFFQTAMS